MHSTDKTPLTWLIAGGAPRSGTTALGTALNMSRHIAIFHEYQSFEFFAALDGFFREEDRMRGFKGFARTQHLIPTREAQARDIAESVFRSVFPEKRPLLVGTKSPSYEMIQQPVYPEWIQVKTIHITRNPYDVVLSSLKKNLAQGATLDQTTAETFKADLNCWISAWNHAALSLHDVNFLHLFYDDLITDPEKERRRVAKFLHGIDDFSFRAFKAIQQKPAEERFREAGLEEFLPLMATIAPTTGWLECARRDLESGKTYEELIPPTEVAAETAAEPAIALETADMSAIDDEPDGPSLSKGLLSRLLGR